jgi:hypothetical protein
MSGCHPATNEFITVINRYNFLFKFTLFHKIITGLKPRTSVLVI